MRKEQTDLPLDSRSAKKRAARAVEELAARLLNLAEADLRRLPLTGEIARELALARSIKAHGARKRQLKFLAGLLRNDEAGRQQAESFVRDLEGRQRRDAEAFHRMEALRDALCDGSRREATLKEIETTLSGVDSGRLRRLAESVENTQDKRAFREIFRRLREAAPSPE